MRETQASVKKPTGQRGSGEAVFIREVKKKKNLRSRARDFAKILSAAMTKGPKEGKQAGGNGKKKSGGISEKKRYAAEGGNQLFYTTILKDRTKDKKLTQTIQERNGADRKRKFCEESDLGKAFSCPAGTVAPVLKEKQPLFVRKRAERTDAGHHEKTAKSR